MIEKGKISSMQMGMMLYPTTIATAIFSFPADIAKIAKNGLWLSPIIASLIGFLVVFIAIRLHNLFPKQTVMQYSEKILGKFFGKALGVLFVFTLFVANGTSLRQFTELSTGIFLLRTPMIVTAGGLLLVCGFAVRAGLEVVARSTQILLPIYVLSLVMIIILIIPEFNLENLFPILENGFFSTVKAAVVKQTMFTLFFLTAFLLPFVSDTENVMKWNCISICLVTGTLVFINLTVLLLFGENVSYFTYPFLSASRYVRIGDFLEQLESIVFALWVAGTFVKIAVQYYVTALATAQLLGLSSVNPVIFPIGPIIFIFSIWGIPNFTFLADYMGNAIPYFSFSMLVVIPLMLLVIAIVRKKISSKKADAMKI